MFNLPSNRQLAFVSVLALATAGSLTSANAQFNGQPGPGFAPQAQQQTSAMEQFRSTLAQFGSFQNHPRYGEVWIPNPQVTGAGWRPYPQCNWTFDRQQGAWTYNDQTPWGQAVHHYGRWANDPSMGGWLWVPGAEFGPGWVQWQNNAQQVSWAAMGPEQDGGQPAQDAWQTQDVNSFNTSCAQQNQTPGPMAQQQPQSPGFAPQAPGFAPQAPGFAPQAPGFAPPAPGFAPQTGFGPQPQAPGFAPPQPGFAPQIAAPQPQPVFTGGGGRPGGGGGRPVVIAGGFPGSGNGPVVIVNPQPRPLVNPGPTPAQRQEQQQLTRQQAELQQRAQRLLGACSSGIRAACAVVAASMRQLRETNQQLSQLNRQIQQNALLTGGFGFRSAQRSQLGQTPFANRQALANGRFPFANGMNRGPFNANRPFTAQNRPFGLQRPPFATAMNRPPMARPFPVARPFPMVRPGVVRPPMARPFPMARPGLTRPPMVRPFPVARPNMVPTIRPAMRPQARPMMRPVVQAGRPAIGRVATRH